MIRNNKVMIFSKSYCPFCTKAKNAFKEYIVGDIPTFGNSDYEVMELDDHPDAEMILDYLHARTGHRTVPRVFINGICVGGGDETVRLYASGELKKMLSTPYSLSAKDLQAL